MQKGSLGLPYFICSPAASSCNYALQFPFELNLGESSLQIKEA